MDPSVKHTGLRATVGRLRLNMTIRLASGLMVAVVIGTASPAFSSVKGDIAAWAEITAAFKKLTALRGYRVHQTLTRGSAIVNSAIFEIAPPNSVHVRGQMSSTIVLEVIAVGKETRDRVVEQGIPSPWRCNVVRAPSTSLASTDDKGNVIVTRHSDTVIDNMPVHAYTYAYSSSPGTSPSISQDVWIGTQTRLPRRLVATTSEGQLTKDFYAFGDRITITLPPCG